MTRIGTTVCPHGTPTDSQCFICTQYLPSNEHPPHLMGRSIASGKWDAVEISGYDHLRPGVEFVPLSEHLEKVEYLESKMSGLFTTKSPVFNNKTLLDFCEELGAEETMAVLVRGDIVKIPTNELPIQPVQKL